MKKTVYNVDGRALHNFDEKKKKLESHGDRNHKQHNAIIMKNNK